ncbi:uncharacterized protein V6R79_015502 [Siganus canaliculatus]
MKTCARPPTLTQLSQLQMENGAIFLQSASAGIFVLITKIFKCFPDWMAADAVRDDSIGVLGNVLALSLQFLIVFGPRPPRCESTSLTMQYDRDVFLESQTNSTRKQLKSQLSVGSNDATDSSAFNPVDRVYEITFNMTHNACQG